MFRWSSSVLNPEPASDAIRLEELGTISLDNSVNNLCKFPLYSEQQLSLQYLNESCIAIAHLYTMKRSLD